MGTPLDFALSLAPSRTPVPVAVNASVPLSDEVRRKVNECDLREAVAFVRGGDYVGKFPNFWWRRGSQARFFSLNVDTLTLHWMSPSKKPWDCQIPFNTVTSVTPGVESKFSVFVKRKELAVRGIEIVSTRRKLRLICGNEEEWVRWMRGILYVLQKAREKERHEKAFEDPAVIEIYRRLDLQTTLSLQSSHVKRALGLLHIPCEASYFERRWETLSPGGDDLLEPARFVPFLISILEIPPLQLWFDTYVEEALQKAVNVVKEKSVPTQGSGRHTPFGTPLGTDLTFKGSALPNQSTTNTFLRAASPTALLDANGSAATLSGPYTNIAGHAYANGAPSIDDPKAPCSLVVNEQAHCIPFSLFVVFLRDVQMSTDEEVRFVTAVFSNLPLPFVCAASCGLTRVGFYYLCTLAKAPLPSIKINDMTPRSNLLMVKEHPSESLQSLQPSLHSQKSLNSQQSQTSRKSRKSSNDKSSTNALRVSLCDSAKSARNLKAPALTAQRQNETEGGKAAEGIHTGGVRLHTNSWICPFKLERRASELTSNSGGKGVDDWRSLRFLDAQIKTAYFPSATGAELLYVGLKDVIRRTLALGYRCLHFVINESETGEAVVRQNLEDLEFKKALKYIAQVAWENGCTYPLILSLDITCGVFQRSQMSADIRNVFGARLFDASDMRRVRSISNLYLSELEGRVVIRSKRLNIMTNTQTTDIISNASLSLRQQAEAVNFFALLSPRDPRGRTLLPFQPPKSPTPKAWSSSGPGDARTQPTFFPEGLSPASVNSTAASVISSPARKSLVGSVSASGAGAGSSFGQDDRTRPALVRGGLGLECENFNDMIAFDAALFEWDEESQPPRLPAIDNYEGIGEEDGSRRGGSREGSKEGKDGSRRKDRKKDRGGNDRRRSEGAGESGRANGRGDEREEEGASIASLTGLQVSHFVAEDEAGFVKRSRSKLNLVLPNEGSRLPLTSQVGLAWSLGCQMVAVPTGFVNLAFILTEAKFLGSSILPRPRPRLLPQAFLRPQAIGAPQLRLQPQAGPRSPAGDAEMDSAFEATGFVDATNVEASAAASAHTSKASPYFVSKMTRSGFGGSGDERGSYPVIKAPSDALPARNDGGGTPSTNTNTNIKNSLIDQDDDDGLILAVEFLSGRQMPRSMFMPSDDRLRLVLRAEIIGARADAQSVVTRPAASDAQPVWNETFVARIRQPDSALLVVRLGHMDQILAQWELLAIACAPVTLLRPGLRWIPLTNPKLQALPWSGLLVRLAMRPVSSVGRGIGGKNGLRPTGTSVEARGLGAGRGVERTELGVVSESRTSVHNGGRGRGRGGERGRGRDEDNQAQPETTKGRRKSRETLGQQRTVSLRGNLKAQADQRLHHIILRRNPH